MSNKYEYHFNTREAAEETLDTIKRIAEDYAYVSIADVADIFGLSSSYGDNKLGWTKESLKNVYVARDRYGYLITLPLITYREYSPKIKYREYSPKNYNENSTPEPLCITIHTKDVDSIDEVLADTFKYIYTIKDRMVNLTIM